MFGGTKGQLYNILSEIPQGCPASGSMFVISIDPFLRILKARITDMRTKAFADDTASVLRRLRELGIVAECFDRFELISGLALKPRKCRVIPLGSELTDSRKEDIEEHIKRWIPQWSGFQVCSSGEYLGFQVGPSGGTVKSWAKPLAKYVSRASEVAASGLSAYAGTTTYNAKVATVTSYVEQLCEITPRVRKAEVSAIEKILHAPHNSIPKHAAAILNQSGMRRFIDLEMRSKAAQYRTAVKTCTCWREELQALDFARREYGPCQNLSENMPLRDFPWWASEAFADVLRRAGGLNLNLKGKNGSIQADAYKALLAESRPLELSDLILPKVRKHFIKAKLAIDDDFLADEIRLALDAAKKTSTQAAWALLRTWTNGWVTASRVGGARAPCIFGCGDDGKSVHDTLQHYIVCPVLWSSISSALFPLVGEVLPSGFHNVLAISSSTAAAIDAIHRQNLISAITVSVDVYNIRRHSNLRLDGIVKASIQRFLISGTIKLNMRSPRVPGINTASLITQACDFPRTPTSEPKQRVDADPVSLDLSDFESPEPPTPRVQLVWDSYNLTDDSFPNSIEGPVSARRPVERRTPCRLSTRGPFDDFCEPECSVFPPGQHHPCCSQATFALEALQSSLSSHGQPHSAAA